VEDNITNSLAYRYSKAGNQATYLSGGKAKSVVQQRAGHLAANEGTFHVAFGLPGAFLWPVHLLSLGLYS
jgi:hypothetical protein